VTISAACAAEKYFSPARRIARKRSPAALSLKNPHVPENFRKLPIAQTRTEARHARRGNPVPHNLVELLIRECLNPSAGSDIWSVLAAASIQTVTGRAGAAENCLSRRLSLNADYRENK
jgi:hypothetical protein